VLEEEVEEEGFSLLLKMNDASQTSPPEALLAQALSARGEDLNPPIN
jgi:hypothetical protein